MNMTITESDKKLLSFLVAFLLAVLFIFLVFRPLAAKNDELKREITTTKDQEVAMDMSASLAEDMAAKEQNTQEKMQQVLQRFYPMLQSQEAENMVTILMLNHNLKVQNLSVVMMEKPSELKWYQYSENATVNVPQESTEQQENTAVDAYGVYTARITCTAQGSKDDLMALVDDISMNYPAISIMATEWSVIEQPAAVQMPAIQEAESDESETAEEAENTDETEAAEEVKTESVMQTIKQTGSLTISLEIYMCEQ